MLSLLVTFWFTFQRVARSPALRGPSVQLVGQQYFLEFKLEIRNNLSFLFKRTEKEGLKVLEAEGFLGNVNQLLKSTNEYFTTAQTS